MIVWVILSRRESSPKGFWNSHSFGTTGFGVVVSTDAGWAILVLGVAGYGYAYWPQIQGLGRRRGPVVLNLHGSDSDVPRLSLGFYDKGDEDHCYIKVTNNGRTQRISVRAEVLEFRDPKKNLNPRIFHVPWESQGDSKQHTEIRKGDFANLLLATFHNENPKTLVLKIRKLGTPFCETQWSNDHSQRLRPAYHLLLRFHGDKGIESDFRVWVYPKTREGPLRVSTNDPGQYFIDSGENSEKQTVYATPADWRQLENDFKSIGSYSLRADWSKGQAGENWRICGDSPQFSSQFKALGRMAGNHVVRSKYCQKHIPREILQISDPVIRWLETTKVLTSDFRLRNNLVYEVDEDGNKSPIYSGHIPSVDKVAANLCLHLASLEDQEFNS